MGFWTGGCYGISLIFLQSKGAMFVNTTGTAPFLFPIIEKSHLSVAPMVDDLTGRLNSRSITWVYSVSLPATLWYNEVI